MYDLLRVVYCCVPYRSGYVRDLLRSRGHLNSPATNPEINRGWPTFCFRVKLA